MIKSFSRILNYTRKLINIHLLVPSNKNLKNKMNTFNSPKWKYSVTTDSALVTFNLEKLSEPNQYCEVSTLLHDKHKHMKLIFPKSREHTCKHPEFALSYEHLKRDLEAAGYKTMWPLDAVCIQQGQCANQPPPVEHTTGRKRRRQPTFTVGEEEDITEEERHIKGLLLAVQENNPDCRCEVTKMIELREFMVGAEIRALDSNHWVSGEGEGMLHVTSVENSEGNIHPAFLNNYGNMVFHSLAEVEDVLEKCPEKVKGRDILKTCQEEIKEYHETIEDGVELKNPFIVIEGLDGTGKSTLVENLVKKLGATKLQTPPPCLLNERSTFDKYPTLIRRLYYAVGNYLVAKHVAEKCDTTPVVMDRFWHSTTAYTIAGECVGDDAASVIPPDGHWVYKWPEDLLKPDIVILLVVSEQVRSERIGHRGLKKTAEEKQMDKNAALRHRILESYKRMADPEVVEVLADGTKEAVLQAVMEKLKLHGIDG